MSVIDWMIVAAIAVLLILAVRYSWKHKGSCGGCCENCVRNCAERKN